jgi:hypothetical protein
MDLTAIKDMDIAALLGKIPNFGGFVSGFKGVLLDYNMLNVCAYSKYYNIKDALFCLLDETLALNGPMAAVLALPTAFFGKAGVESMMKETRSIFSFEDYESIFDRRVSFNVNFFRRNLPNAQFSSEIEELRALGLNLSVRLNSVSTAFVLDLFPKEPLKLPENFYYREAEGDISLEEITESDEAALLIHEDDENPFYTIIGDYIHINTYAILKHIKISIADLAL